MSSLAAHNFHIMMIDDDPDDLVLFTYAMEELPSDYVVSLQHDSSSITQVLKKEIPNIIFLDLNMPQKNGYECLKEIRSHEEFNSIPVVIYSTSSNKKEIAECYKHGANSYVVKPVSVNAITKMIKEVCNINWTTSHLSLDQNNFVLKFE